MMAEFDIRTETWEPQAVLANMHFECIGITLDADSRDPLDRTSTRIPGGTPIAKLSGGTYKPVRRAIVASSSYDSGDNETTITLDNESEPFAVGDTIQIYDGVDGTVHDLGAVTAVGTDTVAVAGDETGDISADEIVEVTENGQGTEVLFLIDPIELEDDDGNVIDKAVRALIHGFVVESNVNMPEGVDAQLRADTISTIAYVT